MDVDVVYDPRYKTFTGQTKLGLKKRVLENHFSIVCRRGDLIGQTLRNFNFSTRTVMDNECLVIKEPPMGLNEKKKYVNALTFLREEERVIKVR